MERHRFVAIVEPLALAMRAQLDAPTWSAYYMALKKVPEPLLERAVHELMTCDLKFFPKAGEIRASAERQRQAILAANPFTGCEGCNWTGWVERELDGVKRAARCECRSVHVERLRQLGAGEPLLLPAPEEAETVIL